MRPVKKAVVAGRSFRKAIGGKSKGRGKMKGKKSRFGPAGIVGRGFLKATTGF
jgi:hypothetical protein